MHVQDSQRMSEAEYRAYERTVETRNEYVDGYVVAMSGPTIQHNLIVVNLLGQLRSGLQSGACRVFPSSQRIFVPATGNHFYPDASVVCGRIEQHPEDDRAITNPKVIVEVLSDSTEDYDHGTKFKNYRQLDSLQDYILVSQHARFVEHFERTRSGWHLHEHVDGALKLESIGIALSLDEIYQKIDLAPAQPG